MEANSEGGSTDNNPLSDSAMVGSGSDVPPGGCPLDENVKSSTSTASIGGLRAPSEASENSSEVKANTAFPASSEAANPEMAGSSQEMAGSSDQEMARGVQAILGSVARCSNLSAVIAKISVNLNIELSGRNLPSGNEMGSVPEKKITASSTTTSSRDVCASLNENSYEIKGGTAKTPESSLGITDRQIVKKEKVCTGQESGAKCTNPIPVIGKNSISLNISCSDKKSEKTGEEVETVQIDEAGQLSANQQDDRDMVAAAEPAREIRTDEHGIGIGSNIHEITRSVITGVVGGRRDCRIDMQEAATVGRHQEQGPRTVNILGRSYEIRALVVGTSTVVLLGLQLLSGSRVEYCITRKDLGAALMTWAILALVFTVLFTLVVLEPLYWRRPTGPRITHPEAARMMTHFFLMGLTVWSFINLVSSVRNHREPVYVDLTWLAIVLEIHFYHLQ